MSEFDQVKSYIKEIEKELGDIDHDLKKSIIQEIEAHLTEKIERVKNTKDGVISGGDIKRLLTEFGKPDEIALEYQRQLSEEQGISQDKKKSSLINIIIPVIVILIAVSLITAILLLPLNEKDKSEYSHYIYRGDHYLQESIWIFLYSDNYMKVDDTPPSLVFAPNANYLHSPPGNAQDFDSFYEGNWDWVGEIDIYPSQNLTLSISGVKDKIFNPDIYVFIDLTWTGGGAPSDNNANIAIQMRCDGDGDGNFEYIINFPDNPGENDKVEPSSTSGQPIDMTNGTIELIITRTDNNSSPCTLWCSHHHSYIQAPFDVDTDQDGTGDYSDTDDDNDGHIDKDDYFLRNPNEWMDSDGNGIGDNEDEDDNGNGIPDILEIPLVVIIILITFIIIVISRKKKFKEKESDNKK